MGGGGSFLLGFEQYVEDVAKRREVVERDVFRQQSLGHLIERRQRIGIDCASAKLVSALQAAAPDSEMLLLGTTDGFANIHAPNERVMLDEFEKAVVAEAEFFRLYALAGGSS